MGITFVVAAVSLSALATAPARAAEPIDVVDAYLQKHGLAELRVEHLSERLTQAEGERRRRLAERLASLYARLLERAEDPDRRADLERRGRELLSQVPEAESLDLRLELNRAAYLQAEKTAERWRVRLVDAEQRERARRKLISLARELEQIGRRAHQRLRSLRRQEEAGGEYDRELLSRSLQDARRRRSLAMFLAGWANVYVAEMTDSRQAAREAEVQFGWLLNAEVGEPPALDRLPERSLRFEHVARAAVGVAVARTVQGDAAGALDWLDTVARSEHAPRSVVEQLPARRMAILARLGRWEALASFVRKRRGEGDQPLSSSEARLLGVLALEAPDGEPGKDVRASLARIALADLVARRELGQVVDLTSRYGTAPIGEEGFIAHHVRGLRVYESARAAHKASDGPADEPTRSAETAAEYLRAARSLRTAVRASDAGKFSETRASATLMIGLSLYYASGSAAEGEAATVSRLREAAERLEQASERLESPERSADALWMAIRALKSAAERGDARRSALVDQRKELEAAFLDRYPEDDRAGVLIVRRAEAGDLSDEEAVELLLDVPRESSAWEAAQRRAARRLYTMYRRASERRRDWAALRYASAAEPLLTMDRRRALEGDAEAASRATVRARRLMEALLGVESPDADRAAAALDALKSLIAAGVAAPEPLRPEIDYRTAQIALVRGDEDKAERIIERLREQVEAGSEKDEQSERAARFAAAGERLLYERAARRWRDRREQDAGGEEIAEAARAVVERGARVIFSGEDRSGDATEADLSVRATVAHAAFDLWKRTESDRARSLSLRLHRGLLRSQPRDRDFLRRTAELAEAAGDISAALDAWRVLGSGLERGSDAWFEARWRLMSLLAEVDPQRAREALSQHKSLRPSLGPPPWDERFGALEKRLNNQLADESSPTDEPGSASPKEGGG